MAIDFMTALRTRARMQERGARQAGRPLTQVEAVAPYMALAETAGERLRAGKSIELAEASQAAQKQQFRESLEFQRAQQAENVRLANERIAEEQRAAKAREAAEAARLAEQVKTREAEMSAAEKASKIGIARDVVGTAGQAVGLYGYGKQLGWWGKPTSTSVLAGNTPFPGITPSYGAASAGGAGVSGLASGGMGMTTGGLSGAPGAAGGAWGGIGGISGQVPQQFYTYSGTAGPFGTPTKAGMSAAASLPFYANPFAWAFGLPVLNKVGFGSFLRNKLFGWL